MRESINRRAFIKTAAAAGAGVTLAGPLAASPVRTGANDRLVVAIMGVNGRGSALADVYARGAGTEVAYIADVDLRVIDGVVANVAKNQARTPKGVQDFRRALDDADVDALVIAAPDHWHAPATVLALQAGKHVYVEKPCGHNPAEGELLVEAQRRYDRVVQMGNQQRSAPTSIQIVEKIRDGIVGRPYYAKAWYANTRGPIGHGEIAGVPEGLDYELWQGPAPRTPYRDNIIHYNWHWFWRWGTGEVCNNGTHEIDVARWALGVDYPVRVSSHGGRYHYDDDWEFYDTQVVNYDFDGEKTITWEGRSCNGRPIEGRGRGTLVHGTEGTVIVDRDGYEVYDLDHNLIEEAKEGGSEATLDTRGGGDLTDYHVANFAAAVRGEAAQHAPIDEGHKSVLLCHLGNIAQATGEMLDIDPATGRIVDNPKAMRYWTREYAPGWEPKL